MKKKPSILRQLLLNILFPVLLVIVTLSGISYYLNRQKLKDSNDLLKKQIVGEAKSLLSMYDESLQLIEEDVEVRMTAVSRKLHDEYFKTTDSITTADLYRISLEMGVDTVNESIYIINRNGVIINTTYRPDMNLDFYKVDSGFISFFQKVWQKNELMVDRFGGEMSTGKIKKYSFHATNDGQYIIELGFYSKKANTMAEKVRENINGIRKNFPNISKIRIYVAVADMKNDSIPEHHFDTYNRATKEKTTAQLVEEKNGKTWYHDYSYLNIKGAKLYSGYILRISSNDSRERDLLASELKRFVIIFILTVLPLTLLIYFRSRAITRPIRLLTKKAEVISKGNLEERVPVEGALEIAQLSGNFNTMVNELQELYKGLEEKVRVRTIELQHQK
ncbi:MAG: HAMP domain-containing protein [Flavobacteriales bacterium]